MNAFRKLDSYEQYYNDVSILEVLWKIVKVIEATEDQFSRIREGIEAVKESMKYASISEKAIENSIQMYKLGHRDMLDNLLYSIAASKGSNYLQ